MKKKKKTSAAPAAAKKAPETHRADSTQQPKKKKDHFGLKAVLLTLALVCGCTVLVFVGIFLMWVNTALKGNVEVYIDEFETKVSTELYYQVPETEEWVMYQTLFMDGEDRIWVDLEDTPKNLRNAAVAIEDKRFEKHPGVDFKSTVRAIVATLSGHSVQGGSTITQQTIKNITGDNQGTVYRKVTEIYRALEMEKRYEKDEILEAYLNEIYLGQSCYGVESASLRYFNKHVGELTLAECASLISITNNPSQYGPFESEWSREQNRSRQLLVLGAMLEQGMITQSEYNLAKAEDVYFANGYSILGNYHGDAVADTDEEGDDSDSEDEDEAQAALPAVAYTARNSYFTDAVIEDVAQALMDEYGYDYETAINRVYGSGYKIYTTQNPDYQRIAEGVFEDVSNTPYTRTKDGEVEQLQGAITVMDPYTGYVVAMVGGVGPKTADRGWNWATSVRPCGSATKPISVYAPALDKNVITGASVIDDYPLMLMQGEDRYPSNDPRFEGSPWPKNDYSGFKGLLPVRTAITRSANTCATAVCRELGVWESYDFMTSRLGFTTLTTDDSTALGAMALGGYTRGVTTEEMAAAYGTFVNEGIYTRPRTFTRVEDANGNTVLENEINSHAAIKESTAALMNDMLIDVVANGTGTAAYFDGMPVAGKTGTTNDQKDRYFVGYSPYFTAAVWTGYESNASISSGGINPAAVLWRLVMSQIHEGLEYKDFFNCSDLVQVTVCADSGMIASAACESDSRGSRVRVEWVSKDNQPTTLCTMHTGSSMLNYARHYFVNFPEVVANDSDVVRYGEPVGTPLDPNYSPLGSGYYDADGNFVSNELDDFTGGTPFGPTDGTDNSGGTADGGAANGGNTDNGGTADSGNSNNSGGDTPPDGNGNSGGEGYSGEATDQDNAAQDQLQNDLSDFIS